MSLINEQIALELTSEGWASPPDTDVPNYRFRIVRVSTGDEMGHISLRAGFTENIRLYRGNIGFGIHEQYRGHYYATKACLLLRDELIARKLTEVYLTCNKTNIASRKSIERLPVEFLGETTINHDSLYIEFYPIESRTKLRYLWRIA